MPTLFSRIIAGDIPGRFVWADAECVAIADVNPLTPGHVMVIPRTEVNGYWEAEGELMAHLIQVAQILGNAQIEAFGCARPCVMIQGFDVDHLHVHVIPATDKEDLVRASGAADPAQIDASMQALREALVRLGYIDNVPITVLTPELAGDGDAEDTLEGN